MKKAAFSHSNRPVLTTRGSTKVHRRRTPVKPFLDSDSLCEELNSMGHKRIVKAGTVLFRAGEDTQGVFLVLRGRFALSAGKDPVRITRIAECGSLLGLPATVRNKDYSLTAEAVANAEVCFITAPQFRTALKEKPTIGLAVIEMLAQEISDIRKVAVYQL